ncbi:MAG: HEAT repeat domain-containing protein [Deltaproteobacteria bacterium]|nr:MAG: HEAT repeat domain-containing protein [Deltaproteobacteria bacterium]
MTELEQLQQALDDVENECFDIIDLYDITESLVIEDEATLELLLSHLETDRWRVEMAITETLGRSTIAHERIGPILVQRLHRPDSSVVEEAAKAFARFPTQAEAGAPRLIALLNHEHPWKRHNVTGVYKAAICRSFSVP